MKWINIVTMQLFSLAILLVYFITALITIFFSGIAAGCFWVNKKLALSLVWSEVEILKLKEIQYSQAEYQAMIDEINGEHKS